jgi:hypothetical protein
MGGSPIDAVLRRIGRHADGWFPQIPPDDDAREALDTLYSYAESAGRSRNEIGIEARFEGGRLSLEEAPGFIKAWAALGATHIGFNTMGAGFADHAAHLDAIRRFKQIADETAA